MRELWIIDRHKGQLGNRLMFFAAAYAWCLEEGARLYCPTFYKYADLFPALAGQTFISPNDPAAQRAPAEWGREEREAFANGFAGWRRGLGKLHLLPGVVRKPSGCSAIALPPTQEGFPPWWVRRQGRLYMLAWRFFNPVGIRRHRSEILRATTPTAEVEAEAEGFVSGLDPSRLWVGAHVRGKDYAEFLGGKHFHSLERYREELGRVAAALEARSGKKVGFVVFADEPRRAEEFGGLDVVISGGSAIADLARMSRLKMIVGPMSTFTAWAMYRSGGVAYQFGPRPEEDGLQWVYAGYPVVRGVSELVNEGMEEREGGRGFEPGIDVSAEGVRPGKVSTK